MIYILYYTKLHLFLQTKCGLPITTYFSASKLRWLIDHVPEVSKAVDEGRCMFGTVDTWLIWVSIVYYSKDIQLCVS